MAPRRFHRQTFIIQILNNQHASWQGTLTWVDSSATKEFRSVLELIRLMDSAVEPEEKKPSGPVSPPETPEETNSPERSENFECATSM